jgi:hypothetical protein
MTAVEKAKELVDKYSKYQSGYNYKYKAKQCAFIAADEILTAFNIDGFKGQNSCKRLYWNEVKNEINKL